MLCHAALRRQGRCRRRARAIPLGRRQPEAFKGAGQAKNPSKKPGIQDLLAWPGLLSRVLLPSPGLSRIRSGLWAGQETEKLRRAARPWRPDRSSRVPGCDAQWPRAFADPDESGGRRWKDRWSSQALRRRRRGPGRSRRRCRDATRRWPRALRALRCPCADLLQECHFSQGQLDRLPGAGLFATGLHVLQDRVLGLRRGPNGGTAWSPGRPSRGVAF